MYENGVYYCSSPSPESRFDLVLPFFVSLDVELYQVVGTLEASLLKLKMQPNLLGAGVQTLAFYPMWEFEEKRPLFRYNKRT